MIGTALISFLPGLVWIGTIYVENGKKQIIVWIALFLDLIGPVALVSLQIGRGPIWPASWKTWSQRVHEFVPGNNIEHRIERTNAFVALVLGYSVVAILYQSSVAFGINLYFGKAVLGKFPSILLLIF
jgi:low temperature requirement protein LtrA